MLLALLLVGGLTPAHTDAAGSCTFDAGVHGLVMHVGETRQFDTIFFVPLDGEQIVETTYSSVTYPSVTYPSGDPVINVSPTGLITAIGPGHTRWEVQVVIQPPRPVAPYPFEVCVPGGADEDRELPSLPALIGGLEIGETHLLQIDPGDFEIRDVGWYPVTWEREEWEKELWSGPVISFDTTSRLITALEPGVATLTAIVSYGPPGSTESRQIELSSRVGVASPIVSFGFNDLWGEYYLLPYDDPDDYFRPGLDTQLRVGDIVEVRSGGAILSLPDYTSYIVRPGTRVRIGPDWNAPRAPLQMLLGHIWVNVKQILQDGSMDIEMSQAVAGIKGTLVSLHDDGTTSTARVIYGSVEFTPNNGAPPVMLGAGEQAVASAAGGLQTSTFDVAAEVATLSNTEVQWLIDDGVDPAVLGVDGPTQPQPPKQPAPPPTAPTFSFLDVDEFNVHYAGIMAVAQAGITTGCTADRFCPADAVTRDQMATFLARGLRLPGVTGHGFIDVSTTSIHSPGIASVAAENITTRCAPGRYCPKDPVTRAQMATFLARALELPAGPNPGFTDVPTGYTHLPGIASVAAENITTGCAPGRYCPKDPVTRAQMATFLARALGLLTTPPPDPQPPTPDPLTDIARNHITAGESHTCALTPNGTPVCWGEGAATEPPAGLRLVTLSSGRAHVCGLEADGTVHCWGRNSLGEASPPAGLRLQAIGLGDEKSCGVTIDGELVCWGGVTYELADPPAGSNYRAVAAGQYHACALTSSGEAVCWANDAMHTEGDVPAGLPPLRAIAAGQAWTCAITHIGDPVCWGRSSFVHTAPGNSMTMVSGTNAHACALLADGTPICWGNDAEGQLAAPDGERFAFIDAGEHHTCGITRGGGVRCWGKAIPAAQPPSMTFNAANPAGTPDPDPTPEVDVAARNHISAGEEHTCALTPNGTPVCWGEGPATEPPSYARLVTLSSGRNLACGIEANGAAHCWGQTALLSQPPTPPAMLRLQAISTGHNHACGVDLEGRLACWGNLPQGLADVPAGSGFRRVASGNFHSCALTEAGQAVCWAQLPSHTEAAVPTDLPPLRAIEAGHAWTCGITTTDESVCWGRSSYVGAEHNGFSDLAMISAGYSHVCARLSDDTALCWGSDAQGMSTPPGGQLFAFLGAGWNHTCGITTAGSATCWGTVTPASTPPDMLFDAGG